MEKQNFRFSAAFLILRGKMKELSIFVDGSGEQDGASFELYSGQFIHNGSNSKEKIVMNIN